MQITGCICNSPMHPLLHPQCYCMRNKFPDICTFHLGHTICMYNRYCPPVMSAPLPLIFPKSVHRNDYAPFKYAFQYDCLTHLVKSELGKELLENGAKEDLLRILYNRIAYAVDESLMPEYD